MRLKRFFNDIVIRIVSQKKYVNILRQSGITIGKNCYIDKKAVFGSEPYLISIGNDTRITRGVKFITHDGGLWVLRNLGKIEENLDKVRPINIGNNCNIGWNVIILPGVSIGNNCVIGAGAIVTRNVPDDSVAAGVPAKVIQSIDEYFEKNKEGLVPTRNIGSDKKKAYLLKVYKNHDFS